MAEQIPEEPVLPPGDAPIVDRGGKGVVDFAPEGARSAVRRSLGLLPGGQRRLLALAAGVQISLGLLDLLGIALIGMLAAIAVRNIVGHHQRGAARGLAQ